jgi:hypothetical protein
LTSMEGKALRLCLPLLTVWIGYTVSFRVRCLPQKYLTYNLVFCQIFRIFA